MKNVLLYSSLFMLLVSYLSSLNAFRLDMAKPFKKFSHILLFLFLCECFGIAWPRWLYKLFDLPQPNQWFYNIFYFFTYSFYLYFFYLLLQSPKAKKRILVLWIGYAIFAIFNYCFWQGYWELNTYTLLVSSSLTIFVCLNYYYQLLYAKEIVSLKRDTGFWISTGLLIYHLASTMGLFLINFMGNISHEKALYLLYATRSAALIMYINLSIAYLCHKKT